MSQNNRHRTFSCEFFPPSTEKGMSNLLKARQDLEQAMSPAFFSVTFGAGGSNRDRTLEAVKQLRAANNTDVAPHISCIGSTRGQIDDLLQSYIDMGVKRLVVLRGDIPQDGKVEGDFRYASELVAHIRETTGGHFHIEVAAYPEYHPESPTPADDFAHFANKVRAGANSAITQYFYNIEAWLRLVDQCETANLGIPVVPGIMPITNYANLVRFSDNCGADIPRWIRKNLEAWQDDKESLLAFGAEVVSRLCQQLLEQGAPGLHFYTLNQSAATLAIWANLSV